MVDPGDGERPPPPRDPDDPAARQRRRLIRKAGLLAVGLFTAAVLLAVAGGALLALLLADQLGVGYVRAWISATALLIGIPLVVQGLSLLQERWRAERDRNDGS